MVRGEEIKESCKGALDETELRGARVTKCILNCKLNHMKYFNR